MEDKLKVYFKDYLYGNTTVQAISTLLEIPRQQINDCYNVLTQEVINDYRKGQFNKALEVVDNSYKHNKVKELISLYNLGEFKANDYTIKDWVIMDDKQREKYLVTELNY